MRRVGTSLIVREAPACGSDHAWNYPLHQIANKVAPAIAAGCTVVLKPSEVVPLNAFVLAEVCAAVGLPGGVFNLVTGTGPVVGEAIVSHPQTDMISFTGSTRAGRRVSELAAQSVKPVSLSWAASRPTCPHDATSAGGRDGGPRLLHAVRLHCADPHSRPRLQLSRPRIAAAEPTRLSRRRPFATAARRPLVSEAQRDRCAGTSRRARRGAKFSPSARAAQVSTRLLRRPDGLLGGHARNNDDRPEEILGRLLAIMPSDDEDDAVRIANATITARRCLGRRTISGPRVAARIARQGDIHGGAFNPMARSAVQQSVTARELGRYASRSSRRASPCRSEIPPILGIDFQ